MLPFVAFQPDPKKETGLRLKVKVDEMHQEISGLMVARQAIDQEITHREQLIAQYVSELASRKDE
jgi:hypothetical protein